MDLRHDSMHDTNHKPTHDAAPESGFKKHHNQRSRGMKSLGQDERNKEEELSEKDKDQSSQGTDVHDDNQDPASGKGPPQDSVNESNGHCTVEDSDKKSETNLPGTQTPKPKREDMIPCPDDNTDQWQDEKESEGSQLVGVHIYPCRHRMDYFLRFIDDSSD